MLSLVPFDIDTIDSGLGVRPVNGEESKGTLSVQAPGYEASDSASGGRQADLVGTILALGMKHLGDAGPTRCAVCSACVRDRSCEATLVLLVRLSLVISCAEFCLSMRGRLG